jgi:hypothetical protein
VGRRGGRGRNGLTMTELDVEDHLAVIVLLLRPTNLALILMLRT